MKLLTVIGLSGLTLALPQATISTIEHIRDIIASLEIPPDADLTELFPELKAIRNDAAKDPALKACQKPCHKVNAECTANCLTNLLTLDLLNLVPCLSGCGAASATCNHACDAASKPTTAPANVEPAVPIEKVKAESEIGGSSDGHPKTWNKFKYGMIEKHANGLIDKHASGLID